MHHHGPFDSWITFAVRFFFGALLGAFIGGGVALRMSTRVYMDYSEGFLWLVFVGGVVGLGLLAALAGDEFWENLPWRRW
jgi:hypothetical protein